MKEFRREPVWWLLGKMCLQATFSLFVYSAYSFTDTWIVARWVGVMASTGIGILSPVFFILSGISTTLGTGAASMLSRALGEHEPEKSASIVTNTMILFLCCALAFTVLGEMFLSRILIFQGAKGEIYDAALAYGRILIAGAVTSTGFSALMRTAGQLKYATLQWVVPIGVNLCFDIVFICGLRMGVEGAAWATILSQFVSSIFSLYYFFVYKKKPYSISKSSLSFDKSIMREIIATGCPSLFQQIGNSIIIFVFQILIVSVEGGMIYVSYGIVNQIMQIFWMPHTGIAQGVQPLAGYFKGSGDFKKEKCVVCEAIMLSILYGTGSMAICKVVFKPVFLLFTDEPLLLKYGEGILRILILLYPIKGVGNILLSIMQAEGKTRSSWVLSLFYFIAIQLPCLFLGKYLWGVTGLWRAMVVSECIYIICAFFLFRKESNHGKCYKKQETSGRY